MHVAELRFVSRVTRKHDAQVNAVHSLLAAYDRRGQTARANAPLARVSQGYRIVVRIPERDALAPKHGDKWVRKALREIREAGLSLQKVTIIGMEPETRPACACRRRPFLILFTTFLHDEPAVRCGACFGPVSLYRLPATDVAVGSFQNLLFWVDAYQSLDELFIGSRAGERLAHAQLSRHDSELSKDGREVAAALEKKTHRPVYCFLSKYFGKSEATEQRRACPSCGGRWLLDEPLHRMFEFKCDKCRLLGNIASAVRPLGDNGHAPQTGGRGVS